MSFGELTQNNLRQLQGLLQTGVPNRIAGNFDNLSCSVDLKITRTYFSPKRPTQIYLADASDPNTTVLIAEYLGAQAQSYAAAQQRSLSKSRRQLTAAETPQPNISADDNSGLVLRQPGLDKRLPGLQCLRDTCAGEHLLLQATGIADKLQHLELVSHRLGRRAVILFKGERGQYYCRLRTTHQDRASEEIKKHRRLQVELNDDGALQIPNALGVDAALGATFYAPITGAPWTLTGTSDVGVITRLCEGLRRMQHLPANWLRSYTGEDESKLLRRNYRYFTALCPDLATKIKPALNRVTRQLCQPDNIPSVVCHRDLHQGQIFLTEQGLALLDFDTLCRANPALDVGNLLAHISLAGARDECDASDWEDRLRVELNVLRCERTDLWFHGALLRLIMLYAMTAESPEVLRRLISRVEPCWQ